MSWCSAWAASASTCVQGARMVGANMIVGVDLNPDREALGRKFGMTHFVNPKTLGDKDLVAHLVELTDGGADYSFECVGNTKLMRQALECCHRGWGKSVIIGVAGAGQEIATRPFQLVTGRSWMGTAFGGAKGRRDVPKIVDWYMDRQDRHRFADHPRDAGREDQRRVPPDARGQVDPQRRHVLGRKRMTVAEPSATPPSRRSRRSAAPASSPRACSRSSTRKPSTRRRAGWCPTMSSPAATGWSARSTPGSSRPAATRS